MRFSKVAAAAALTSAVDAQRPTNTTICDYYTTALLKNNTAANQATVLTLLVNTVVIGNYTKPNIEGITWPDVMVPGILANGTVNGTAVNLAPFFNGGLASTNRDGKAVSVNFLDGGGAEPLMMNKAANDESSNQYRLLTHLYQFFGTALGCSQQGKSSDYSAYQGVASQYEVHKFMALNYAQNTYFITQVALAAASFGVAESDITAVGTLLGNVFNRRCGPKTTVIPDAGPQLQSICIAQDCPVAENATCADYAAVVQPGIANATNAQGQGNSSNTMTASASNGGTPTASAGASGTESGAPAASSSKAAAVKNAVGGIAAAGLGMAAFFL